MQPCASVVHDEYQLSIAVVDKAIDRRGYLCDAKYANHICAKNGRYSTLHLRCREGDLVFIEALCTIPVGAEVLRSDGWSEVGSEKLVIFEYGSSVCKCDISCG